jgi:hypothetical protein
VIPCEIIIYIVTLANVDLTGGGVQTYQHNPLHHIIILIVPVVLDAEYLPVYCVNHHNYCLIVLNCDDDGPVRAEGHSSKAIAIIIEPLGPDLSLALPAVHCHNWSYLIS